MDFTMRQLLISLILLSTLLIGQAFSQSKSSSGFETLKKLEPQIRAQFSDELCLASFSEFYLQETCLKIYPIMLEAYFKLVHAEDFATFNEVNLFAAGIAADMVTDFPELKNQLYPLTPIKVITLLIIHFTYDVGASYGA